MLEFQPCLTCRRGQCINPTVITEATSIKDDALNSLCLSAFGDLLTDHSRRLHIASIADRISHLHVSRIRFAKRLAGVVIDQLNIDVLMAAVDTHARALLAAPDPLANPQFATESAFDFQFIRIHTTRSKSLAAGTHHGFALFSPNLLIFVPDTFAVIGLGFAQGPDLSRELPYFLLVRAFDEQFCRI